VRVRRRRQARESRWAELRTFENGLPGVALHDAGSGSGAGSQDARIPRRSGRTARLGSIRVRRGQGSEESRCPKWRDLLKSTRAKKSRSGGRLVCRPITSLGCSGAAQGRRFRFGGNHGRRTELRTEAGGGIAGRLSDQSAQTSREMLDFYKQQQAQITPFATSRMNNGLPFANAMSDASNGTIARSFAPARAQLQRRLSSFGSLPSGSPRRHFRTSMRTAHARSTRGRCRTS
jgi:hypothetical protein